MVNCRKITIIFCIIGLIILTILINVSNHPNKEFSTVILIILILVLLFFGNSERIGIIRRNRINHLQRRAILRQRRERLRQIRQHMILIPKNEIVSSEQCVICLNYFNDDNNIVKLMCEHRHHVKCIKRWLIKNPICPLCKYNIFTGHEIPTEITIR
mgnify:FL=1|tara:strand:+ start:1892 stop:2362 length:471 start_codon:yes stop_codon:yes gene_type:complete